MSLKQVLLHACQNRSVFKRSPILLSWLNDVDLQRVAAMRSASPEPRQWSVSSTCRPLGGCHASTFAIRQNPAIKRRSVVPAGRLPDFYFGTFLQVPAAIQRPLRSGRNGIYVRLPRHSATG